MRAYLAVSGTVVALIVLGHVRRFLVEGPHVWADAVFIFSTVLTIGVSAWGWRLFFGLRARTPGVQHGG